MKRLFHDRAPPVDQQTFVRMNRGTLYSGAIVTSPPGRRSSSRSRAPVSLGDDREPGPLHRPGIPEPGHVRPDGRGVRHPVCPGRHGARRPGRSRRRGRGHALQDQFGLQASSARPFVMPAFDQASFDAPRRPAGTRQGPGQLQHAFGAENEVDPVLHLIGTAAGSGGLPDRRPLCRRRPGPADREVPADRAGRPWTLLVDLAVQRGRVLRAQRPRRLQHRQRHRRPRPGRVGHHPLRRLRQWPAQLSADYRRLELRRPPLPPRAEILDGTWAFPTLGRPGSQRSARRPRRLCSSRGRTLRPAATGSVWGDLPFLINGERLRAEAHSSV